MIVFHLHKATISDSGPEALVWRRLPIVALPYLASIYRNHDLPKLPSTAMGVFICV